jgi:hypothetical protein
VMLDDNLNRK